MHFSLISAFVLILHIEVSLAFYPTTGVKTGIGPDGYRPPRREILELSKDDTQFSLYVQAMNSLMSVNETSMTSYFQIAGIHGRPYESWDNVNPKEMNVDGFPTGFCPHANILFATWHRPYLALLEQLLGEHAQEAAKAYNSSIWTKAADELRIPYWDWAAPPQLFPEVMTAPTVQITTPTGTKNVKNPLYRYEFLNVPEPLEWFPEDQGFFDAYQRQPCTLRWPDEETNTTHAEAINQQFTVEGSQEQLRSQVWSVFSQTSDFNSMSTNGNNGPTFENPHNQIHGYVGGLGHMSWLGFSGFEPAFWLHHVNVDRQFAMWQAIHPDSFLTPEQSASGTWTIFPGTTLDANTPLTPFTAPNGESYTSVTARYTKTFGYSYPEVQDWLFTDPTELAANVTASVNTLYNPTGDLGPFAAPAPPIKGRGGAEKRAEQRAWTLSASVPNGAVGSAFDIIFSSGSISVGKLSVLAVPSSPAENGRTTHAQFSLNRALKGMDSSDVQKTVDLLKSSLKWKVVKRDGSVVEVVKGLEVAVADQVVVPARSVREFPIYGEKRFHPEIVV